jgi:hypothetical protein
MFSDTYTGTCLLPLCTAMVKPIISGTMVLRRDQALIALCERSVHLLEKMTVNERSFLHTSGHLASLGVVVRHVVKGRAALILPESVFSGRPFIQTGPILPTHCPPPSSAWARANSDWFYRSNDLERQAVECNTGLRLAQGVFRLESRNLGMG